MKTPLFDQLERKIIREDPKSIFATRYEIARAKKNFVKEFAKAFYIEEILNWVGSKLSKIFQSIN